MLNQVILIGRLVKKPVILKLLLQFSLILRIKKGTMILNFSNLLLLVKSQKIQPDTAKKEVYSI